METLSALLAICAGNSPVPGEFPTQRPVTRSFGVFFDLRLNKRLSKQSWGWWFETLSRPLWRQCNATMWCPPSAHACLWRHNNYDQTTFKNCQVDMIFRSVLRACHAIHNEFFAGSIKRQCFHNGSEYWRYELHNQKESFETILLPTDVCSRVVTEFPWSGLIYTNAWRWLGSSYCYATPANKLVSQYSETCL